MSSAGLAPAAHIKLHGIMPATIGNVLKSLNPLNQGMKKKWTTLDNAGNCKENRKCAQSD